MEVKHRENYEFLGLFNQAFIASVKGSSCDADILPFAEKILSGSKESGLTPIEYTQVTGEAYLMVCSDSTSKSYSEIGAEGIYTAVTVNLVVNSLYSVTIYIQSNSVIVTGKRTRVSHLYHILRAIKQTSGNMENTGG